MCSIKLGTHKYMLHQYIHVKRHRSLRGIYFASWNKWHDGANCLLELSSQSANWIILAVFIRLRIYFWQIIVHSARHIYAPVICDNFNKCQCCIRTMTYISIGADIQMSKQLHPMKEKSIVLILGLIHSKCKRDFSFLFVSCECEHRAGNEK